LLLVLVSGCGETRRGGGGGGGGGDGEDRASRTTCLEVDTVEAAGIVEVFRYEASRPNAMVDDSGTGDDLPACSERDVFPWVSIIRDDAAAACERSGFSLCTMDQWLLACGGSGHQPFPYGTVEKPGYCNDHQAGGGKLLPSGSKPYCVSPDGVYDIIGNVWEWVSTPGAAGEVRYTGHGYKVTAIRPRGELKCDTGYQTGQLEYDQPYVGFRCCREL